MAQVNTAGIGIPIGTQRRRDALVQCLPSTSLELLRTQLTNSAWHRASLNTAQLQPTMLVVDEVIIEEQRANRSYYVQIYQIALE